MAGKIIITEGAAPSAPVGTGKHTIYIDTVDDKLKIKDEAGVVDVIASEAVVDSKITAALPTINTALLDGDIVVISKSVTDASGTTTYNHSLGRIPNNIIVGGGGSNSVYLMSGSYVIGGEQQCIYSGGGLVDATHAISSTDNYGVTAYTGTIQNVTATTFDIVRAKSGTPSGTLNLILTLR